MFGSIVVRESNKTEKHFKLYDFDLEEHVVILNDWSKQSLQSELAKYFHTGITGSYNSILINGRGLLNSFNESESVSSSSMDGMEMRKRRSMNHMNGMMNMHGEKMGMGMNMNMQKDNEKDSSIKTPLSIFKVKKGFRYRFRVIDAGLEFCPMQFSIDKHNLTLIATDGNPIDPVEVESFVLTPGKSNSLHFK